MIFRLLKCNSCPGVIAPGREQLHVAFELQKGSDTLYFTLVFDSDDNILFFEKNEYEAVKKALIYYLLYHDETYIITRKISY